MMITLCILYIGAILTRNVYSLNSLEYFIASVNCTGDESSLLTCPYSLMDPHRTCNYQAMVICQGTSMLHCVVQLYHL